TTLSIARAQRLAEECPPNTDSCNSSRSLFQLVNLDGQAVIWGAEGGAKLLFPYGFSLRATVSYAWGDGPNPGDRPDDPNLSYQERVPLSRIPPLNGTVEGLWRSNTGFYLGVGYRWATLQDRLAISDQSDDRIPLGGTPGFSVLDLRAGYRHDPYLLVSGVLENVTDEAYRYHGSSVNGAGRGLIFNLEVGY
ncbi:MAG: TonB-dependent receptor, partial [Myxococcota bacterium]